MEHLAKCAICKNILDYSETVPDTRDRRFKTRRLCDDCFGPIRQEQALKREAELKRAEDAAASEKTRFAAKAERRKAWELSVSAAKERKAVLRAAKVLEAKAEVDVLEIRLQAAKQKLRLLEATP